MKKFLLTVVAFGFTAAMAADGAALYAKCASCHGQKGEKKPLGKPAVIKGQSAADLEKKLKGYKAGTLNLHGMGALMKAQVASLSDEDIKALAEYMATFK